MNFKEQATKPDVGGHEKVIRKKYSMVEKIQIVMEGLSSENSISEFCKEKGISTNLYYKWRKDFLEADKTRLARVIENETTTFEVSKLKIENMYLMQLVTELSIENRKLKRKLQNSD